jgi:hypothetical protein
MKRLRTTFTCLFLLAAFTSIIPMDSCQSPASKQKTDANVVSQTSLRINKTLQGPRQDKMLTIPVEQKSPIKISLKIRIKKC